MPDKKILETFSRSFSQAIAAAPRRPRAFVGLDGFIDEIVQIVDQRQDFNTYTPIRTIGDYARRLAQAAGKSTNVELVLKKVKLGGNGPLMADALGRLGSDVVSVGAFGYPVLNPTFEVLREYGEVVSIADNAVTIAAEFEDGKIMHGKLETLNEIVYDNLVARSGGREAFRNVLRNTDLMALVNWTMIPHLTSVWKSLREELKTMGDDVPRYYFFDVCDPQKRSREDLREAVQVIASFDETGGQPILGLNEKESLEVCETIGVDPGLSTPEETVERARRIAKKTGIPEIVIHPTAFAAACGPEGEGSIQGPLCRLPYLTTGAGDSFNGGYTFARVLGLPPQQAIGVGVAVSGFYVRAGRGPRAEELARFYESWADGSLDPWTLTHR